MSSTSRDGTLALTGSLLILSTVTLGLRFYGRKQNRMPLLADDWTAFLGVVTFVGTCIVTFIYVQRKYIGYSITDFTPEELTARAGPEADLAWAFDFINTTTLALVKVSALFMYRRTFHTNAFPADWFSISSVFLIVLVGCWYIAFQVFTVFQCHAHFDAVQDGESAKYCTLDFPWAMGLAVSDFLLDFIILILPIPRILRLQMKTAKKLSVIGCFALAFVGLGASIAKIVIYNVTQENGLDYFLNHDIERAETQLIYIQMLEAGISITAANLPTLWRLFSTTIPEQVMQGMHSLRSLQSIISSNSQSGRKSSEGHPAASDQAESVAVNLEGKAAIGEREPQISQHPSPWDDVSRSDPERQIGTA